MADQNREETIAKLKEVLNEKIRPALASHNGDLSITSFEDGVVAVRLLGECTRCSAANSTLEDFIKIEIMEAIPEIKDVVLDLSVPEDMLAMARKILRHEI